MRAHYLSPATKGISVDVTGPANVKKSAALTVGAKGCTSSLMTITCALRIPGLANCPSSSPCYTASIATYDAYNAASSKIPPSAHELSAIDGFKFTIASGNTIIPVVLDGIAKSIALLPSRTSVLTGSQAHGLVFPKCTSKPQIVSIVGIDADGNYIAGTGAPAASLSSGDKAQLAVKKTKASTPNAFTLAPPKPPAYPYGGHTVHLIAKLQPGIAGMPAISATIAVTYSPDICGVMTEFPIPTAGAHPYALTLGADNALWFTEASSNKIGRITTAGSFSEFSIPTAGSLPTGITTGADGNLWFVENNASKVGKLTPSGSFTEYPTLTAGASPYVIAAGPTGDLWFPEDAANKIGRITTAGARVEYTVPTANSNPYGIGQGPDGNMWFTETSGNKIGVITPSGTMNEIALTTPSASPIGFAAGSDGDMWFTECNGNKIGHISSLYQLTAEAALPESGSQPTFMARGPGGTIWFNETLGNRIAELGNGLTFTEYAVPTAGAYPFGLVEGPDGAMWFTEFLGSKIVRLR
jgi:virginiamycin B lyase